MNHCGEDHSCRLPRTGRVRGIIALCLLIAGANLLEAKVATGIDTGPRLGQIIRDPNHLQWL
ncbi:MAG: hypothetical protein KC994_23175, partial [Candidatus Omnitrophica bacterium]|nr:hypothetical protein [Candidatus Omnitrophota bacterium]